MIKNMLNISVEKVNSVYLKNMLSLNASSYCIFYLENRSYTDSKLVYYKFLYIKSNESKRFPSNLRPIELQWNPMPLNNIQEDMKYSFQFFIFGK